jgi:hypothetical protein
MNSIQEKTKFKVMKILNKVKKLKLTQLKKAGNNQMNRRKARIKEGPDFAFFIELRNLYYDLEQILKQTKWHIK